MRIVVTGARGYLGTHTVSALREASVDVMATDTNGRPGPGEFERFLNADLTDAGQVYDALDGADSVIHLAAIAAQRIFPSGKTFLTNVSMVWNVLEAAARLGIKRVVLASSLQVNHTVTPRDPIHYQYFPVDEEHPVSPQDDYGLSKYVGEKIADTFAHHWGLTVVSFRFPFIANAEAYAAMPMADPIAGHIALGAYVHVRDAARACYLAATADLPPRSHHVLFATARDSCMAMPTRDYLGRYFPEADIRPGLDEHVSPINSARAERVVGFVPEYSVNRQN